MNYFEPITVFPMNL